MVGQIAGLLGAENRLELHQLRGCGRVHGPAQERMEPRFSPCRRFDAGGRVGRIGPDAALERIRRQGSLPPGEPVGIPLPVDVGTGDVRLRQSFSVGVLDTLRVPNSLTRSVRSTLGLTRSVRSTLGEGLLDGRSDDGHAMLVMCAARGCGETHVVKCEPRLLPQMRGISRGQFSQGIGTLRRKWKHLERADGPGVGCRGRRLLDHDVGVGPAEAERTDPGQPPADAARPGDALRSGSAPAARSKGSCGLGLWRCRCGGISSVLEAKMTFISPAMPAAASRWPMFVFTEPIQSGSRRGPNTAPMAPISIGSPRAVPVPWASR